MSETILLVFALAAALVVATKLGLLRKRGGGEGAEHRPLFPQQVLTSVEQQFCQRLLRAFPDHVTLVQPSRHPPRRVRRGRSLRRLRRASAEPAAPTLHPPTSEWGSCRHTLQPVRGRRCRPSA